MILRPLTIEEAERACAEGGVYAAGLTAAQLAWPRFGPDGTLVDLAALDGLAGIEDHCDHVVVGAMTPLETIRTHPIVRARLPALAELLASIGGAEVRRLGTLGGQIGWGAGDTVPLLVALDARARTREGAHPVDAVPARRLVTSVEIPIFDGVVFTEKVGYRAAFSPTLVTVAGALRVKAGVVSRARLAAGGGVTTSRRLIAAEAMVAGRAVDAIDRVAVAAAVRDTLVTQDDAFASAAHRRDVAARVIAFHLGELAA